MLIIYSGDKTLVKLCIEFFGKQVAKWLVNGLSNREIGEKMFISTRTVKAHLTSIFKKTGCRDRLELATRMK